MPRKKKIVTTTEEIPDRPFDVDDEPQVDMIGGEDENVAEILSQYGPAQIKIKVSRWTPQGPEHCFTSDNAVDEDFIQDNYGGGRYTLRIFVENKLRKSLEIRIADRAIKAKPANDAPNPQQFGTNDAGFLQNLLMAVLKIGPQTVAPQTTPVGELAEAIKTLHSINGGGSGANGTRDYVDGFKAGMELAKDMTGTGDWKTDILRTVREVAPGIAGALTGRGPQPQPAQVQRAVEALRTDPDATLKMGITYLKARCMSGVPAALIIDWAIANASDPQYQQFVHAAFNRSFDEFVKLDAEIANEPYATWFKSIYDGLRSEFVAANEVEDDSEGSGGNDSDTSGNANVSDFRKPGA